MKVTASAFNPTKQGGSELKVGSSSFTPSNMTSDAPAFVPGGASNTSNYNSFNYQAQAAQPVSGGFVYTANSFQP